MTFWFPKLSALVCNKSFAYCLGVSPKYKFKFLLSTGYSDPRVQSISLQYSSNKISFYLMKSCFVRYFGCYPIMFRSNLKPILDILGTNLVQVRAFYVFTSSLKHKTKINFFWSDTNRAWYKSNSFMFIIIILLS